MNTIDKLIHIGRSYNFRTPYIPTNILRMNVLYLQLDMKKSSEFQLQFESLSSKEM
jgi:hypothetical protein